eukprot:517973_1
MGPLIYVVISLITKYVTSIPQLYCTDMNEECEQIMLERNGIDMNEFNSMMPLHQAMLKDYLSCVREDKCPLHLPRIEGNEIQCIDGYAIINDEIKYPCSNVDLLSFIPLIDLGSEYNAAGNDIWGWTDYDDNNNAIGYYVITCQTDGTSIVDITEPINPNVLAFIQSNVEPMRHVNWRDAKVFNDHVYVVADTNPHGINDHALQIYNIRLIIERAKKIQDEFGYHVIYNVTYNGTHGNDDEVWVYNEFNASHNIFINEQNGYLYSVGTLTCSGGLHVVDINDAKDPKWIGCFEPNFQNSYVHDVQCVQYHGPDTRFKDHEICFAFTPYSFYNPPEIVRGALSIMDVQNKNEIILLAEVPYNNSQYTHQGWTTGNHKYLLLNDEMDETFYNLTQRTYIWDIRNLTNPKLINVYDSNMTVVDHNEYIIDNAKENDVEYKGFVFQSNYEAGLRILNIDNIANGELFEVAYFDNYIWEDTMNYSVTDDHNNPNYRGSWSVYPYFKLKKDEQKYSNVIAVQNINTGLYILRHNINLNDIFDNQMSAEMDWILIGVIIAAVLLLFISLTVFGKSKYCTCNKLSSTKELDERSLLY